MIDIRPMLDPMASKAALWLPIRPGTDVALLLAWMHVLITEQLYDQAYIAQYAEGWWVKPGAGYSRKYRCTVWSVMFLAQLGADGKDPRVRLAGDYILDHGRASYGGFSAGASSLNTCVASALVKW